MSPHTTNNGSKQTPLFNDNIRNLEDEQFNYENVSLKWISEVAKQDLNTVKLEQALCIIDDFIEERKADTLAEVQLALAFKTILMEKRAISNKPQQGAL